MYKKFAAITLLMFGLGALPTHAADAGSRILLAENSDQSAQPDKPKEKAPDSNADAKKDDKAKSGDKKGGDEPNCEN
ncbi:MAG: hypothetical protein AB7U30_05265 [Sulfuricellaceae bacterium]